MRLFRPEFLAGIIYPEAVFRIDNAEKQLCLTFDDGPDPDSTPELLSILERYNIRCIFFCDGRAAEKYPGLMTTIISRGHIVGNHGYNHLDGWKTKTGYYLEDIERGAVFTSAELFRPPYGRLRISQYRRIKTKYQIILWDVMAYDFDKRFGAMQSLNVLKQNIRPGSVIVLHDKAGSSANTILEEFILYAKVEGYDFSNFKG
jgi:peptidoglycan/xylan/chitin deacetylase (PgdA/CDA1 family)